MTVIQIPLLVQQHLNAALNTGCCPDERSRGECAATYHVGGDTFVSEIYLWPTGDSVAASDLIAWAELAGIARDDIILEQVAHDGGNGTRDGRTLDGCRHFRLTFIAPVPRHTTAKEPAPVMPPATASELWLRDQLDRIHPQRHEVGAVGDTPALTILAFQLKEAKTQLEGEAKVMCTLLEESLKVLSTLEPEDDNEHARLESLKRMIVAVVEAKLVQP